MTAAFLVLLLRYLLWYNNRRLTWLLMKTYRTGLTIFFSLFFFFFFFHYTSEAWWYAVHGTIISSISRNYEVHISFYLPLLNWHKTMQNIIIWMKWFNRNRQYKMMGRAESKKRESILCKSIRNVCVSHRLYKWRSMFGGYQQYQFIFIQKKLRCLCSSSLPVWLWQPPPSLHLTAHSHISHCSETKKNKNKK